MHALHEEGVLRAGASGIRRDSSLEGAGSWQRPLIIMVFRLCHKFRPPSIDAVIIVMAAPLGVKSRDVSSKSKGNARFAYLADRTGGGLLWLPSSIAARMLLGLLGLAVT